MTYSVNNDSAFWFLLTVLFFIPVGIGICYLLKKQWNAKRRNFVENTSTLLSSLRQLNQETHFYDFPEKYAIKTDFNSKPTYDHARWPDLLMKYLQVPQNRDFCLRCIRAAAENRETFTEYEQAFQNILCDPALALPDKLPWYLHKNGYLHIQNSLVYEAMIRPAQTFSVTVIKYYRSPKGRNEYEDDRTFFVEDLMRTMQEIDQNQLRKSEIRAERAKMKDALRYEVLKRDGFRCKFCGRTADVIELEVDHIIPVAKGGKTEMSNLQTLCKDCNRGKSDSYDEESAEVMRNL